jgi:hypothetical protein
MERLYQIVVLCALLGCSGLTAADQCSLVVRALTPDGERPEAPISVLEQNGRVERHDQEDADVRFCDLGILPVTVKVGSDGICNQVTIKDVPIRYGETYLLTVTYDPGPCLRDTPPPPVPVCTMLFRVTDRTGEWLPKAQIRLTSPTLIQLMTDEYGRAIFHARVETRIAGTVSAITFRPKEFAWTCSQSSPLHEEQIRLE